MDSDLRKLNVLFVCSGPAMYKSYHYRFYKSLEEMERIVPKELYKFLRENNLIKTLHSKYFFDIEDLPEKIIIQTGEIEKYSLYREREYIINSMKKLYPNLETIEYISVDPTILNPNIYGDEKIQEMLKINDNKFLNKYGVRMIFKNHYMTTFQNFIKINKEKFDSIFFLVCSNFDYVIDKTDKFLSRFKKLLKKDSLIFHIDNTEGMKIDPETGNEFPVVGLTSIDKRFKKLPKFTITDKRMDKIKWFLNKFEEIEPGIYKFKTIPKEILQTYILNY